jgi:hypothetical protein
MSRRVSILIALLTSSCAHVGTISTDGIPAVFPARAIQASATKSFKESLSSEAHRRVPAKLIRFYILAWQRTDTLNPYVKPFAYSDSCITWSEFELAGGGRRWGLAHLQSGRGGWQEAMVFDAPYAGCRSFNHCPNNREVLRFLKDSWWLSAATQSDPGIVEAGVCKRAWLAALGAPPPIVLSYIERPKENASYY